MLLINSAINPVRQFIHQKRHKPAIDGYLARQRAALDGDTERKLAHFKDKSIIVQFDDLPDAKPISGISVKRCDLPTARVGESIVLVHLASKQQAARGLVISVNLNVVKIKLSRPVNFKNNNGKSQQDRREYRIKFEQRSVLEKRFRVEKALRKFKTVNCSVKLHKIMLGDYKDWSNVKYNKARVVSLGGSAQLHGPQLVAVEQSMMRRISLIEGVAGSGKTLVAATLAYSMNKFRKRRILLCSPMESTINRIGELLAKSEEVLVVKLTGNDSRKNNKRSIADTITGDSDSADCSLVSLVDEALYSRMWKRCLRSVSQPARISQKQKASFNQQAERFVANCSPWLRRKMERKILKKADIVCCTLAQAGSQLMRGLKFEMLIIDDMQIAKETDCLVPMMIKGIKQVTLLSDMRRDIRCARLDTAKFWPKMNGFVPAFWPKDGGKLEKHGKLDNHRALQKQTTTNNSSPDFGDLFERWLSIGLTAVALKHQYRMHETLAAFPNHHYYLSRLKTDTAINMKLTRQICNDLVLGEDRFEWLPNNKCLMAIFDTFTQQSSIKDTVKRVLKNLILRENIHPNRISVITNNLLESEYGYHKVEVGTVIDFYGQERDFVVLACHNKIDEKLASSSENIDFLKDENALNVALTRARVGLFIVADLSNLTTSTVVDKNEPTVENSTKKHKIPLELPNRTSTDSCCKSWRTLVKYYHANKLVT